MLWWKSKSCLFVGKNIIGVYTFYIIILHTSHPQIPLLHEALLHVRAEQEWVHKTGLDQLLVVGVFDAVWAHGRQPAQGCLEAEDHMRTAVITTGDWHSMRRLTRIDSLCITIIVVTLTSSSPMGITLTRTT